MNKFTYLALSDNFDVIATFKRLNDATAFCIQKELCMMPFNVNNSAGTQCPQVGYKYIA